jgi:hypothetical protein
MRTFGDEQVRSPARVETRFRYGAGIKPTMSCRLWSRSGHASGPSGFQITAR